MGTDRMGRTEWDGQNGTDRMGRTEWDGQNGDSQRGGGQNGDSQRGQGTEWGQPTRTGTGTGTEWGQPTRDKMGTAKEAGDRMGTANADRGTKWGDKRGQGQNGDSQGGKGGQNGDRAESGNGAVSPNTVPSQKSDCFTELFDWLRVESMFGPLLGPVAHLFFVTRGLIRLRRVSRGKNGDDYRNREQQKPSNCYFIHASRECKQHVLLACNQDLRGSRVQQGSSGCLVPAPTITGRF